MQIPHKDLSPEALLGLVTEFASRDGTDYGELEVPLEDKINQVMAALDKGEAVVVFDARLQSASIVSREQWIERRQQSEGYESEGYADE